MKRIWSLMVFLLLLAVSASAESWAVYTANGKPLNVRAKPSRNGKVIDTLSVGESVDSMEPVGGGKWAAITYGERSGYCMTEFLRPGTAYINRDLGVMLFYDEDAFQLESTKQADTLSWHENGGATPDCYVRISRKGNTDVNKALREILRQEGVSASSKDFYSVTVGGAKGKGYTDQAGTQEGAPIREYMAVKAGNKRIFVIERSSYVGAEQGAGAAMEEVLTHMAYTPVRNSRPSQRREEKDPFPPDQFQFVEDTSGDMVQCGLCHRWYHEGYEYHTHACFDPPGIATEGNMLTPDE